LFNARHIGHAAHTSSERHVSVLPKAKLEEVEKWPLNYARNANKSTPVASAIMTKKVNAQRRLASMRLSNHLASHQETRKSEVRYDPEQLSHRCDQIEASSANDFPRREHLLHLLHSAGACVFFLRFGIPHDKFFLVRERQGIQLLGQLRT